MGKGGGTTILSSILSIPNGLLEMTPSWEQGRNWGMKRKLDLLLHDVGLKLEVVVCLDLSRTHVIFRVRRKINYC
jgi:hypothetical protein